MIKPIVFGKFILLERISVGGMAEVYRAKLLRQPQFGRYFAIKRILPNLARDEDFVTMFINEAKVAVELEHPNVCQIYELGRLGQSHYIAMEYISGRDVAAIHTYYRRQKKIMSVSQACYIIAQAAQGLDYAHRAVDSKTGEPLNLVHRDVSPQNLLADFSGVVKLIDFGVAKASQRTSHTQNGVIKGKFSYMSPEQASNDPIDHRSDIFALGVIFWELLTGRRLFVSESEYAILAMLQECNIEKPSKYNKMIPDAVDRICMKALAKDRDQRYMWASDMFADLSTFINSCDPPYTMWHLKTWLQTTYADIYGEEVKKLEIFEKINTEEDVDNYNKEHANEKSEKQYFDGNGNITEDSAALDENALRADVPKLPPIPGRASKEDADKNRSSSSLAAVPKDKNNKNDHKDNKDDADSDSYDEFDQDIELTPEGVAPTEAAPEHIRMKRIQKKKTQRKFLLSLIGSVCGVIIFVMLLAALGLIHLPVREPTLPTSAAVNLTIAQPGNASLQLYRFPKELTSKPIQTASGHDASFDHLDAGKYVVEVELPGFDTESFSFELENGTSEMQIEMNHPKPVIVNYNVNVTPENATVYVDDVLLEGTGATRYAKGDAGKQVSIRVLSQGFEPETRQVKIEDAGVVSFELKPFTPSISVRSSVPATLFICPPVGKCKNQGSTPASITGFDIPEAGVNIEVRASGYQTWKKTLTFKEKGNYRLFADLEK